MKKISLILAMLMTLLSVPSVQAEEDEAWKSAAVLETYTSQYRTVQGVNNWYFCGFNGDEAFELEYEASKSRWKNPNDTINGFPAWPMDGGAITPGHTIDGGHVFIAPKRGTIRIRGTANQPVPDSVKGNGVNILIKKGSQQLYSSRIHCSSCSYDFMVSVTKGDEIQFRVNANQSNAFDWTIWWPTVEYIDMPYVEEGGAAKYYQKSLLDGNVKELIYDDEVDGYMADDNIAFVNNRFVMPSNKYSIVKQWECLSDGRYRINGKIQSKDKRGGGHLLTLRHNSEVVWEQMMPNDEENAFDVRLLCKKGDILEAELSDFNYTGYNFANWTCEAGEYIATLPFCKTISSAGNTAAIEEEISLGSLIGATQGGGNGYYSLKNSIYTPMTYNSSSARWDSTISGSGGYIGQKEINPGRGTDTVWEHTLDKSGIMRIYGDMNAEGGDGVVSKIFLNDKLLWSSRVGGERPVRWDEPYDSSYFVNHVDVTSYVKAGDTLKFTFNQWRKADSDTVDISNVKLSYIKGEVLSKTTKWKLNNSVVIDTLSGVAYINGNNPKNVNVFKENGTVYILKDDAQYILDGDLSDAQTIVRNKNVYVPVRAVSEAAGKSVVWAAGRLVLIHNGLPLMYGYSEMSEIETKLQGGNLYD